MQNIGGENAGDAFYRYKMPKLMAKIEGRGNGIKTNVVNNVEVAKALERPPEYLLKFYGCELGAQTNYDKATGTSIVNGAHDLRKLGELLEAFIKKYVQCYSCGNPETTIRVKKEFITLKCKACGAVSDVDMRHKLNTFILKNPPENKLSKEEKRLKKAEEERLRDAQEGAKKEKKEKKDKDKDKDKKDKKDKKKKKDKAGEGEEGADGEEAAAAEEDGEGEEEEQEEEEEDDEVVWMTDTSAEAVAARAAEQLTSATAAMVTQGNIEAELEKERKRAEKEARKKAEEAAEERRAAARAALESGDKVDAAVAADALRSVLAEGEGAASAALRKLSVEGGLAAKARALVEAMFVDEEGVEDGPAANLKLASGIKRGAPLLRLVAADAPGQLAVLVAFEWLCAAGAAERRGREAALALKALYDEDLAEEDIILAWHGRADAAKALGVDAAGAKAVRAAVQPVVEWLQEGEEDSDEDEDDDEDDE